MELKEGGKEKVWSSKSLSIIYIQAQLHKESSLVKFSPSFFMLFINSKDPEEEF